MASAYRKVRNTSEKAPDNEVRITQKKPLRNYVTYVLSQFRERGATEVTLRAMGNTMDKIVSIAEIVKYRVKGLYQINNIGTQVFEDVFEPLEEGLDTLTFKRVVNFFTITLTKTEPKVKGYGFQEPIDESLVDESQPIPRAPREGGETSRGPRQEGERRGGRGGDRRPREPRGEGEERRGGRGGRGRYDGERRPREEGEEGERRPRRGGYHDREGGEERTYREDRPPREDRPFRGGEDRPFRGERRPYRGGEDRPPREDRPFRGGEDRPFRGERRPYIGDRPYRTDRDGEDRREGGEGRGRFRGSRGGFRGGAELVATESGRAEVRLNEDGTPYRGRGGFRGERGRGGFRGERRDYGDRPPRGERGGYRGNFPPREFRGASRGGPREATRGQ